MNADLIDERLNALERQVDELRRELKSATLNGKPKAHIVDRVLGAMLKHKEWDEVIRLGQELRQTDRIKHSNV